MPDEIKTHSRVSRAIHKHKLLFILSAALLTVLTIMLLVRLPEKSGNITVTEQNGVYDLTEVFNADTSIIHLAPGRIEGITVTGVLLCAAALLFGIYPLLSRTRVTPYFALACVVMALRECLHLQPQILRYPRRGFRNAAQVYQAHHRSCHGVWLGKG